MKTKQELMSEGYSETYVSVSELSLLEIQNLLNLGKVTKKNVEDILDRVYEITSELPEEKWGETKKLKTQLRNIKRS